MIKTVTVTLDQLHLSDDNVRTDPGDLTSLTANILFVSGIMGGNGLIQPMVLAPRMIGKKKKLPGYEVIAGGRRLLVQKLLAEQYPERLSLTYDCPLIEDRRNISMLSLAENYAREQMRLPDIYAAFAKMRAEQPNATLEELGAVFGFDPARTARVMRLANLAPEIMTLYSEGGIDDAQIMAYAATEDQKLQVAVYRQLEETAQPPHEKNAAAIRKAMKSGDQEQTRLMRYIGVEAYEVAGGRFIADLFAQQDGSGIVEDPDVLQGLVSQKFAEDKDRYEHNISRNGRVLGENWGLADLQFSWAETPPQIKQYGYLETDRELAIHHPKRGQLSKALTEVLATMQDRLGGMIGEDDEPLPGWEERYEALSAEIEDLEAQKPIILPKKGAVVGIASIDNDGEFSVDLWYADRAAKGLDIPKGAKRVAAVKAPLSPAEAERARFGLSKDNMQAMMLIRRDMIREELFQSAATGSTLATDWLLFTQARTVLHGTKAYGSKTYYHGGAQGISDLPDADDFPGKVNDLVTDRPERAEWIARKDALRATAWASAADPVMGFAHFLTVTQAEKNEAAALIAGHMMMATTSVYSDGRTPRMGRELANFIQQENGFGRWRDAIELDEAFFATFSHTARLGLLDQWGVSDRAKGMKGRETAAFCARIANCDEADAKLLGLHTDDVAEAVNWLPEFIETGMVEPLAVDAAEQLGDDELAGDGEFPEQPEDEGELSEAA